MDNNLLCSWILFYSQSNTRTNHTDELAETSLDRQVKILLCSAVPYVECAKRFNFQLSGETSGFNAIFNYFSNHQGRIIEILKDEDQELFINSLMNYDQFSMKHHLSLIKCFMKAYVCELAPLVRIRRSFLAMGGSTNVDQVDETFKNLQRFLIMWINSAALKGLQKLLQKSNKMLTEPDIQSFINVSSLTSQLLYCMFYYVQTKMMQFSIIVPEVNVILKREPPPTEMVANHASIVMKVFSEICDNQDTFPIHINKSYTVDRNNVPVTLSIALVFHWVFGNSLKTLENLLKMSTSCELSPPNSGKIQNRPTNIFINSNNQKLNECKNSKVFFLANKSTSENEGLNKLFLTKKISKEKNLLNETGNENKINSDGDTSPEIFLTPNEEQIPMTFSTVNVTSTKLLSQKPTFPNSTTNVSIKEEIVEPPCLNLKEEFKKKQLQKLNVPKNKVKVIPVNETTWLEQKNKNETTQIPLTPKKTNKSLPSPNQSDSKTITQAQLNELQIHLGLQRQKIQNNLKKNVVRTGKSIETSKQKAFFQVLNSKSNSLRRNSEELDNIINKNTRTNLNENTVLLTENNIKDNDTSEIKIKPNKNPFDNISTEILSKSCENREYEESVNEIELPQSLQESDVALTPVQIFPEQACEISFEETTDPVISMIPSILSYIPEIPLLEEASVSRKNSSTSISSLSTTSNKSSDKFLINQEDYYKSMDVLTNSLTNLQKEIRVLSEQQRSLSKRIIPHTSTKQFVSDVNEDINSQLIGNNSVPDTPTNVISITEVTKIHKPDQNGVKVTDVSDSNLSSTLSPINQINQSLQCSETVNIVNENPSCVNDVETSCNNHKSLVVKEKLIETDLNDLISKTNEENNIMSFTESFNGSNTDEEGLDMDSSLDSSVISNTQPITFIIGTNQEIDEAQRKKSELLALREEKRRRKMEIMKQKRDQERENRLSETIDELMEREEKKRIEKEKRDSLLQKYLDRKKNEVPSNSANVSNNNMKRSVSAANTPVKLRGNSKTARPVLISGKQDSVGDIPLASSQRSTWFSSMRVSNKKTSQSTSKLNENMTIDSNKFGVPLPPQEYTGPKLFGKRKVKTNRSVIVNAISHCCLAGSVNEPLKETVLKELAEVEGTHFMILFRDARCQFRALYSFDLASDDLNLIFGSGPKKISHEMVEKFYKYNSGAKQFNQIISTKHLSPAVDAICIQSIYWNARPASQMLNSALSTSSIITPKPKRN